MAERPSSEGGMTNDHAATAASPAAGSEGEFAATDTDSEPGMVLPRFTSHLSACFDLLALFCLISIWVASQFR